MKNKIIFKTLMLKGEAGSTIVSMEKTGHVGTADIYTITFNDGSTTEISLENMSAITSVEKTSSTDTEDIYTITCADGSTQTFSVLNHNADIDALSADLSDMADEISTIDARMDNLVTDINGAEVTTLWTGSLGTLNTPVTLSQSVSNFDFIDIYTLNGQDTTFTRVPANVGTAQIHVGNLSDDASIDFLQYGEMGISLSGTSATLTKAVAFMWSPPSAPEIVNDTTIAVVTRIDGVKTSASVNAELADVRVGADGVTYGSAGAAVRGQISDLKEDLVEHNAVGLSFPNAISTTWKGITITKVDAHKFHFSGTATEGSFYNLTVTTNGIFDGGEKLSDFDSFFVEVSSDVTVNKAMFWVETYIKSTDNANWHRVYNAGDANHWQFRYDKTSDVTDVLFRMHWLTGFKPDATFTVNIQSRANNLKSFNSQVMQVYAGVANGADLNDLTGTGIYTLSNTGTYSNYPRQGMSSHLLCFEHTASNTDDHAKWQMLLPYSGYANNFSDGMYLRSKNTGESWSNWFELSPATWRTMKSFYTALGQMTSDSLDLNDLKDNCIVLLTDSISYENKPTGLNAGFLMNILTGTWRLQLAWKFSGNKMWKRKGNNAGTTWEEWQEITGITNTYNNTYEFSEYSNTYNVTATPTITTDTNSYLASTGDTTDRTADIVSMLTQTGVCRLGAGDFYVNGLEMPARTMLCGSGNSTRIILSGTADGYAIKMNDYCIVKDLRISGSTGTITPSETLGGRHGILWQGNYTSNPNNNDQPNMGIVSNVYIDTFTGGAITCYDTGYGTYCHLEVTNVYCTRCGAGINIAYWSEFHKFTNVRTFDCYYGCINNGGNNVFVNCDFSSCKLAFLMDNSTGQSPNNSHGSAIGCTFNHTNSNTGIGIKVLNCANGFIFDGCQIFFSQINLDDSDGIVFSNCNFGYSNCDITIDGGKAILFTGNIYQNTPTITITNNADVHFVNCYNRTTGAVVEP